LWRLVAGIAVLGILVTLLITAAVVYVDNFLLDKYMRALAEQPASAGLSDAALTESIEKRARQLDLPVAPSDISVARADGRPHIRIARYSVQTYLGRMDLRLPGAASR
jgi:hypothetical protein